jgi:hypothetical protein
MKKMLVFSNQAKMIAFLLAWKKYKLDVNFSNKTLCGDLTQTELDIACTEYGTTIKEKQQDDSS